MELLLIRHLPTEWNYLGFLQGRRDIDIAPLSDTAREAIVANRTWLASVEPFDAIITSTLRRTQQTAIAYGFAEFATDPLLDELDFGVYEGRPRSELEQDYGSVWQQDPRAIVVGESVSALDLRIRQFIKKHQGKKRLLVFGHGAWVRGLVSITRHGDLRGMNSFYIQNNELIEVKAPTTWITPRS